MPYKHFTTRLELPVGQVPIAVYNMTHPAVVVIWQDSAITAGWRDRDKVTDAPTHSIVTFGFLLASSSNRLVIAGSLGVSPYEDVAGCVIIPRECILQFIQVGEFTVSNPD